MSFRVRPRASVVIPAFNAARSIADAVDSVRAQSFGPLEIILVDDGSVDDTRSVIRSLGSDILSVHQSNQGPAAARNAGLRIASADLVAFLDADDAWPQDALRELAAALNAGPHVGFAAGRTQCVRGTDSWGPAFYGHNLGSLLFRRTVFERVGLFEETMRLGEDVDWFLRAQEQSIQSVRVPSVTLLYRRFTRDPLEEQQMRQEGLLVAIKQSLDRRG